MIVTCSFDFTKIVIFSHQVKKSQMRPKQTNQSKVKAGQVPYSSSNSSNKSTRKNTVSANQPTVVVSLTGEGCKAGISSDGDGEYFDKNKAHET